MSEKKKIHPPVKSNLHPRNKHRARYDFKSLIDECPELKQFVKLNDYDEESIDFANPLAIRTLNKALLKHFYGIDYWVIPSNYLCPPVPGRADYLHYIADLLAENNNGEIPKGANVRCLDIGIGANCIYPLLGIKEYGWSFIGADIDQEALKNAREVINKNSNLKDNIKLRLQSNPDNIFYGIINRGEQFDVSICNPPFHSSAQEAKLSAAQKVSNLKKEETTDPVLNFGGQSNELWYDGGEIRFIRNMINQSKKYAANCQWFTTLVSKKDNLEAIYKALKNVNADKVKTIEMGQGNKLSRIVAWSFGESKPKKEQKPKTSYSFNVERRPPEAE